MRYEVYFVVLALHLVHDLLGPPFGCQAVFAVVVVVVVNPSSGRSDLGLLAVIDVATAVVADVHDAFRHFWPPFWRRSGRSYSRCVSQCGLLGSLAASCRNVRRNPF